MKTEANLTVLKNCNVASYSKKTIGGELPSSVRCQTAYHRSLYTRVPSVSFPLCAQAVVGAGAAGLVATRELLREDHKVTVFEQNINVGGIWDYQEECETEDLLGRDPNRRHVHSSM